MKRKNLEDMGLSKEQIDTVMKMNGEDIEKAKSDSENLEKENESLAEQLKERDEQLEALKKSVEGNEDLKKQVEKLQADNEASKSKHEAEMNALKVDFAVERALTSARAKNVKAVKALLNLTDAKLDKEGNVKGLQEQLDNLITGEDTSFLFEQKTTPKFTGFQPGVGDIISEVNADFSKMTFDQLTAYMDANPDA